jgi:DNA-binding response OmpR family regulator
MAKRVLIAEEAPEIEWEIGQGRSGTAYQFTYAVGYAEAARLFSENEEPFDFLVTDIMLKPFQGRDLANRIVGLNPGIKVLFMGKLPARLLRSTGLLPPSAPFLHKPFTAYHLLKCLDELGNGGPSWLDLILSQDEEPAASA